jgi:hypothetical protein
MSRHIKDLETAVRADPGSDHSQSALNELIEILNGDWRFARCKAADALGRLGPLAEEAVPDLMRAATSGDMFVEGAAFDALASMGPAAEPAVDLMIERVEFGLAHYDGETGSDVWAAAEGLGNVGTKGLKSIPVLERASVHADPILAERAKRSLQRLKQFDTSNKRK